MNLKIAIKVLGILGAVLSIFLGMTWMSDYFSVQDQVEAVKAAGKLLKNSALEGQLATLTKLYIASYILLLGGILAGAATILINKFKEKSIYVMAGIPVLAAIFAPKSLVFTFFLLIAAGLAFKIKEEL